MSAVPHTARKLASIEDQHGNDAWRPSSHLLYLCTPDPPLDPWIMVYDQVNGIEIERINPRYLSRMVFA